MEYTCSASSAWLYCFFRSIVFCIYWVSACCTHTNYLVRRMLFDFLCPFFVCTTGRWRPMDDNTHTEKQKYKCFSLITPIHVSFSMPGFHRHDPVFPLISMLLSAFQNLPTKEPRPAKSWRWIVCCMNWKVPKGQLVQYGSKTHKIYPNDDDFDSMDAIRQPRSKSAHS